ncbi:MAG: CHASE2 domain-containing protein [Nostocaceae cyanobacterium]|nr:CHASE2 domain-containing protein [Nostocaceae cyanobacterium]
MVLLIFNLGKGNWQQGFPSVIAQLWETDSLTPIQFVGSLPANLELPQIYKRWQLLYCALSSRLRSVRGVRNQEIEFESEDITHISDTEFSKICQELEHQINIWLNTESFQKIERRLRTKLSQIEEIRVIIETEDEQLRRLPWHLWRFFEDYPKAEMAQGTQEYERVQYLHQKTINKVRILAILGNSQGIEIQKDRLLLEQLPGAETVFLVESQRREIDACLWDEWGWDILFFAGHSSSQMDCATGKLEINPRDTISIPQLKNALKAAIARGLQLAIFNSCDGLGLARDLADLQIPQLIVMRSPVPDIVAQEFLKYWLLLFASGTSFYLAVREARERLQGLENEYPCASWLPVICQNPAITPPTWEELRSGVQKREQVRDNVRRRTHPIPNFAQRCRSLFTASVAVTTAVMVVRLMGGLQPLELWFFDHLLRLRPAANTDERLLVVTVTEQDIQNLGQYPISDRTLLEVIKKLDAYQPRAIGLDIYRDLPVEPGYANFATYLQQNPRLVTICEVGKPESENPDKIGVPPPPKSLEANRSFSDISVDPDAIVRRHLFHLNPGESRCQANYALSAELAFRYLEQEGIEIGNFQGNLKLGNTVFKPLDNHSGFYHNIDTRGHQVLLNYRNPSNFVRQITLTEVLENKISLPWIKNKIVLIGVTAPSIKDNFSTPYGKGFNQQISGIFLHAQMVSHFLDVALGKRPLFRFLPQYLDIIWIWIGSFVGSLFISYFQLSWQRKITASGLIIFLFCSCFILIQAGISVPFIPSAIALVITSLLFRLRRHKLGKFI